VKRRFFGITILALIGILVAQAQSPLFTVGYQGAATTLDPILRLETTTINWQQHIFDSITKTDSNGRIQPGIAQLWTNQGTNKWTFVLRRNAVFHDGSKVTTKDLIFSINRAQTDPKSTFKGSVSSIKSMKAIGDYTLEIITERPDPLLPNKMVGILVVSQKQVENNPAWTEKPIGSGAYQFVSWLAGDHLLLEANPNYWGGAPALKRLKLQNIPNPAARVAALVSGQVQLIEKIAPQDVQRISSNNNYKVMQAPSNRVIYLVTDVRAPQSTPAVTGVSGNPFSNLKVREAIARAVDKNLIVKSIMGGYATPATQFVAPSVPGFDRGIKNPVYNLEKAVTLMTEAGYAKGFGLRLDATNDRYQNDALIAQAVGGMLEKIGIQTKVNAVSRTVLFPQLDKGDFSAYISGWSSSDLVSTLVSQAMCKNVAEGYGALNRAGYCNKEVDKLILAAASNFNPLERNKLVSKAMRQILQNDIFWIPLHYENVIHAVSSNYNYKARGDEYINTWEISAK
jgi:peptide/nickel transport system substrate-binding protein